MKTCYLRFPGGKAKALTLSYDDGVVQDIRLVEILKKHGIKCTFNLNSGLFGPEDKSCPPGRKHRRLSKSEVLELYTEDVCEIACHTLTHPFPTYTDSGIFALEVLEDRRNLEAMFGRQVHGMAYPQGAVNDKVEAACKSCGIYYSRTVTSTHKFDLPTNWLRMPATCRHKDPKLMELADEFLNLTTRYGPKIFYLWGHSYEFDDDNNWHVIEDFAEKMSGHEDIWYATNMEIYYAWLDYSRLEFSIDGKLIYNPSVRSVWVADLNGNTYEIKPGETLTV